MDPNFPEPNATTAEVVLRRLQDVPARKRVDKSMLDTLIVESTELNPSFVKCVRIIGEIAFQLERGRKEHTKKTKGWLDDETEDLRCAVKSQGTMIDDELYNWDLISREVGTRTVNSCKRKFAEISKKKGKAEEKGKAKKKGTGKKKGNAEKKGKERKRGLKDKNLGSSSDLSDSEINLSSEGDHEVYEVNETPEDIYQTDNEENE